MKQKSLIAWIALAAIAILFVACTGASPLGNKFPGSKLPEDKSPGSNSPAATPVSADALVSVDIGTNLERIAEIERTGAYFPGLALAESELREKDGDYAGAAVAVYKELSWAYGNGAVTREQVDEGLQNALAVLESLALTPVSRSAGVLAIRGCMAFARENWETAEELFSQLHLSEEPDSFLRWMLLVCSLERESAAAVQDDEGRALRSAYGAIRARYMLFPEYWYRAARAYSRGQTARSDGQLNMAPVYAEQCINSGPQGPFAQDCRIILGIHLGLSKGKDDRVTLHSDLRTKAEIESVIQASVSMNDPKKLKELFPLMALPDNPYTLYALGAMQALCSVPEFRAFFAEGALKADGRLGERLNYISRS